MTFPRRVGFRPLLLVVLGLLINTGENTDSKITCSVPSVELGEATNLTCYFKDNIMEAKQDFLIQHYPQSGSFREILFCYFDAAKELNCQEPDPGYEDYELENDKVTVKIGSATKHHVGRYRCQVIPSEQEDIVSCNFTLEESKSESSTESPALEETTVADANEYEGNNSMEIWEIALAVVVAFISITAIIAIIAIIYRKRRKRRSNTEAGGDLSSIGEPMINTVESPADSKECKETQALISGTKPNHSADDSTEQDNKVTLGNDKVHFLRGASGEDGKLAEQSAPHPLANVDGSPYDQALTALQQTNAVVIVGPEKCGKTKIGQGLLQHYKDKGYTPMCVTKVSDFWLHEKLPDTRYAVFMDEAITTNDTVQLLELWSDCFKNIREKEYPTVVIVKSTATDGDEVRANLSSILQDVPIVIVPKGNQKESAKTDNTTSSSPATLFSACEGGDVEAVKSLLKGGAEVNATGEKNRTPLHVACTSGGKTVVEVLLEKGASIEAKDDEGNTPLHLACHRGNKEIVQLLLDKHAKRFTKNNAELTPSDLAISAGHTDIETLFHVVTGTKVPNQRPRKPKK